LDKLDITEFIRYYELSVRVAYIAACQSLQSSNIYIKTEFIQFEKNSNNISTNLITQCENGNSSLKNMMLGLQLDSKSDINDKIKSVLFMETYFYQKQKVTVKKTETLFGEVTNIQQAQKMYAARLCESDYIDFKNNIDRVKSKYNSGQSSRYNNANWASLAQQYYEARETIISKTDMYTSVRRAFLLGNGIHLCKASSNFNKSKLVSKYYF